MSRSRIAWRVAASRLTAIGTVAKQLGSKSRLTNRTSPYYQSHLVAQTTRMIAEYQPWNTDFEVAENENLLCGTGMNRDFLAHVLHCQATVPDPYTECFTCLQICYAP